jgi:hypothetical protein
MNLYILFSVYLPVLSMPPLQPANCEGDEIIVCKKEKENKEKRGKYH